ncbi:PROTEIN INVOLVED IN RIMO-MEDIATED BETA-METHYLTHIOLATION OF ribosomal protein S12 YCAO [Anaeramoeba flamelloides]|uniref:PROTEIN INVOLVED IN RIMO-MEDIATED BETA-METHYLTHIOLATION OF ribosomal protein S12 YCAO n=1 Tax=Anaeramoeba flamelloides TaxID=1746091 RepID=A0ABQ8YJ27_9EUKA|nr:PROTEIN INVOLVED IN RIMO-MEDIATED BETA-METHYLTHIOLATION OF ribosomal protein S12 YCAO [Anaeramoeba flamelloides]
MFQIFNLQAKTQTPILNPFLRNFQSFSKQQSKKKQEEEKRKKQVEEVINIPKNEGNNKKKKLQRDLPRVIQVEETLDSKYENRVRTKYFEYITSGKYTFGGAKTGPNPFDLIMSSLGTSANIAARSYFTRNSLDVESVKCSVTYKSVKPDEIQVQTKDNKNVDLFLVQMEVNGNLEQEQEQEMIESVQKSKIFQILIGNRNMLLTQMKKKEKDNK